MVPDQPPVGRVRNARGQGQLLRAELIEAAARLLATTERPETLTLRQVTREVGVAPASIYSHFKDLGALLEEVLELRYAEVAALMESADQSPTPLGRLAQRCAIYIRWGIEHPGEYRTVFGGRTPAGITTPSHSGGLRLLDDITQSLAAVTDPRQEQLPEQRARSGILLWTSMHGLVDSYTTHDRIKWPTIDELIVGTVATFTQTSEPEIRANLEHRARRQTKPRNFERLIGDSPNVVPDKTTAT